MSPTFHTRIFLFVALAICYVMWDVQALPSPFSITGKRQYISSSCSDLHHCRTRVRHGYTTGRIFAHRTRTREHCTRTATGTVSAGNGYGFLRNPQYRGYPRFFSTIKYYYLLEKILIIYILCCCCCSSCSYSLSKNKGGAGSGAVVVAAALLLLLLLFSLPPLLARPHSCSPHPLTLSLALVRPSRLPSFAFAAVAPAAGAAVARPHLFCSALFAFPRPRPHSPLPPAFVHVSSWCRRCLPTFVRVRGCSCHRAAAAVVPAVCCQHSLFVSASNTELVIT